MDMSYRRAMMTSENSIPAFAADLVANPLTLVLTLAVVFMLVGQTSLWQWLKRSLKKVRE
jgi:putative tricarboxylic transport membrane protein